MQAEIIVFFRVLQARARGLRFPKFLFLRYVGRVTSGFTRKITQRKWKVATLNYAAAITNFRVVKCFSAGLMKPSRDIQVRPGGHTAS